MSIFGISETTMVRTQKDIFESFESVFSSINEYGFVGWFLIFFTIVFINIVALRMRNILPGERAINVRIIRFLFGKITILATQCGAFFVFWLLVFCYFISRNYAELSFHQKFWIEVFSLWREAGFGLVLGCVAGYIANHRIIGRRIEPWISEGLEKSTKISTETHQTDARTIEDELPKHISFDPRDYIDSRGENVFFGVDRDRNAIYHSTYDFRKNHIQIVGPTGTGKGILACMVLYQSILRGDGVFVIDPKNDEFASQVLNEACNKAGKPFLLINLRHENPAQINPFAGATAGELEEILNNGFGFEEKGTDADFYRIGDRRAVSILSEAFGLESPSALKLSNSLDDQIDEDLLKKSAGLVSGLQEISRLSSINCTDNGVDLESVIREGGCIYVIGSMRDPKAMKVQKMVLIRMMQLIEKRGFSEKRRHMTLFLDELRYLISNITLSLLGTIRDKGCNVILAHQSLGDFALCKGSVDPDSAKNVVLTNCQIKWIYRNKEKQTADWASGLTGEILVETEGQVVERNEDLAEIKQSEKRLIHARRPLFDQNVVQHLPDQCAIIVSGNGLARLAFSSPIIVNKKEIPLAVAEGKEVEEIPVNAPKLGVLRDLGDELS